MSTCTLSKSLGLLILTSLASSLAGPSAVASSYISILSRCTEQNLGPAEGVARNQWARKCFPGELPLIDHFDSRNPRQYALVSNPEQTRWDGPIDPSAPCDNWTIVAFCVASCYTPDQRLLFSDGWSEILAATSSRKNALVTLAEGSTEDRLQFQVSEVEAYSVSRKDSSETIRTFETRSGGSLRVTQNHPMVTVGGEVKTAGELQEGELLIRQNGELDEILRIRDESYFGKVYNVAPASNRALENIVVAEGFLSGSAKYQYNEAFQDLMHRKLLRSNIKINR